MEFVHKSFGLCIGTRAFSLIGCVFLFLFVIHEKENLYSIIDGRFNCCITAWGIIFHLRLNVLHIILYTKWGSVSNKLNELNAIYVIEKQVGHLYTDQIYGSLTNLVVLSQLQVWQFLDHYIKKLKIIYQMVHNCRGVTENELHQLSYPYDYHGGRDKSTY